jgi:hypothetical protein
MTERESMIERDEADELPEVADAITSAIGALIVSVMEATETGSPERARAMHEVLAAAERIRAALHQPRLN